MRPEVALALSAATAHAEAAVSAGMRAIRS